MYTCEICNKPFKSKDALNGHKAYHTRAAKPITNHIPKCCCVYDRQEVVAYYLDKYIEGLSNCLECGICVRNKKFCSHSCSAKYNNRSRKERGWVPSEEQRKQTSESVIRYLDSLSDAEYNEYLVKTHRNQTVKPNQTRRRLPKQQIVGEYSKVYFLTCKFSGKKFVSSTIKQIHPDLKEDRKQYAYSCRFKFGISSYPDWFVSASELIRTFGWYSTPGSRSGVANTNGISRDHLYSISDGWLNKIDPKFLRHPANCELLPHKENQKKNRNSKITLDELLARIQEFESIYGMFVEK